MRAGRNTLPCFGGGIAIILVLGCTPPPEAPTDLSELSLFMIREFDSDEEIVAAGLENLDEFLVGLDCWDDFEMGKARGDREWTLPTVWGDDLGLIESPGSADPENQTRIGVTALSQFPPFEHGELVAMEDQAPAQTASSVVYDREFLTDVDCFVERSCDRVDTFNVIQRQLLLIDVIYESYKDFRWVEMPDGSGTAMIARSWVTERFPGVDDDDQSLEQNFSAEAWIPHPEGTMLFLANWVEWVIPGITDEDMIATLTASGIDEIFEAYEDYLSGDAS